MGNNPVNFNDPTGHYECDDEDANGKCITNKEGKVIRKLIRHMRSEIFDDDGKVKAHHTGLSIINSIVNKAAELYGNDWDGFLSATNYIFLGVYENGPFSQIHSQRNQFHGFNFETSSGTSGATSSGMARQFSDGSSQVRHFWGAFATAASTNRLTGYDGLSIPNSIIATVANFEHDMFDDWRGGDGTTIWDYSLSQTAIDIGDEVVSGNIATPANLAPILTDELLYGNHHFDTNFYSFQWLWKTPFK